MKISAVKPAVLLSVAAAGAIWTSTSWAQNAPSPATQPDPDAIIVTARRTEERLQDVPISITVFNQQQLSNRNIVTAADLGAYTPSLSANNRFGTDNTTFAIRGFVQEGPTSPSVAVYFADVVAPRSNGSISGGNGAGPGAFFDLQNVQILKGPQGTLFGRNTTGGAILLVPQKPTDKLEGYVEGSAGDYNMWRTQGVLNVPVSDKVRLRLGVDHMSRDGYLHNVSGIGPKDFADTNYTAIRGSLVIDLTPNLENYTIVAYSNSNTHGAYAKVISNQGGSPAIAAQLAATSGNFWDVANGRPDALQRIKQFTAINTLTWHASDTIVIKDIASYSQYKEYRNTNLFGDDNVTPGNPTEYNYSVSIGSAPGLPNVAQRTFTNEVQLQGRTSDSRLTYQVGGYLEAALPLGYQGTYVPIFLTCSDPATLQCTDLEGRAFGIEGYFGNVTFTRQQYKFRNLGFYGQSTYKLSDKLSLTAGLRYTSDRTSGNGDQVQINFPAANTPRYSCGFPINPTATSAAVAANPDVCQVRGVQSSAKPTWLIDLDYKPTNAMLLYAKYARGYRQGSITVALSGGEASWQPEKVDTYEIGAKTSFGGSIHGTFNIAGFYNNFTSQQLQLNLTACTGEQLMTMPAQCPFVGVPTSTVGNAGKSRIYGVEVDTSISPFAGLRFDAGYAYLNTKLVSFTPVTPPLGYTGDSPTSPVGGPLSDTPKHKITVTGTYTLPLDKSIGVISFGATYSYQSRFYNTSTAAPGLIYLPGQTNLNLNANWNSVAGRPLDLSLFMTNATNEKFYQVTVGGAFGFDQAFLNPPRMFGGRVRYHF